MKTLFEILNNPENSKRISDNIDIKLNSKEFWKEQEKLWIEMDEQHRKEQESIKMSYEKYIKKFNI